MFGNPTSSINIKDANAFGIREDRLSASVGLNSYDIFPIFAHVLAPERRLLTRWTANLGFFVVASVTGITFSALSDLTQLETSLSSRGGEGAAYIAVSCAVAFFVLLGLWFHVWYARRSSTKLGVVPYLAPRMAVVLGYVGYISILDFNNDVRTQCINQIVTARRLIGLHTGVGTPPLPHRLDRHALLRVRPSGVGRLPGHHDGDLRTRFSRLRPGGDLGPPRGVRRLVTQWSRVRKYGQKLYHTS